MGMLDGVPTIGSFMSIISRVQLGLIHVIQSKVPFTLEQYI